jgi:hypothetical protein
MTANFQLCGWGHCRLGETASSFGNNVWIMGCTWLHNLCTYSLTVILPWRVIMELTEHCTMILLPKPSQNLRRVSLLEPGIPDWVFSKRK